MFTSAHFVFILISFLVWQILLYTLLISVVILPSIQSNAYTGTCMCVFSVCLYVCLFDFVSVYKSVHVLMK